VIITQESGLTLDMPMHPSLRKKSASAKIPICELTLCILNCTTLILNMGLNLQQMKCSVSTSDSWAS
jgi:hypothetical protein